MLPEDGLLKKPDLARRLGVSIGTINTLLRRRQLKPVRIGRCVRFAPSEVDRFVAEALANLAIRRRKP